MRLASTLVVLAMGCGGSSPGKPCERGVKLEQREVDNGSRYMQQLYAHVAPESAGGPSTDPEAREAGVRAEIDQWTNEVTTDDGLPIKETRETDYYLMAYDRSALERYLAARDPVPADREIRLEHVPARPYVQYLEAREHWRSYYLVKQPVLDTTAIADVGRAHNDIVDRPMVTFTLTEEGKQALATATTRLRGKKLAVVVDGVVASAAIITGPIRGGRLSMTPDTDAEVDDLLAKLRCVK